ncbi:MAG: alpha/beta fold hydrolase [Aquiluna sp.]
MKKVLIHHGWTNIRPSGHWARLAAAELRNNGNQVWYPQFPDPDTPSTEKWQELLRQEANMMDEVEGGEKIAICHSLGTTNWLVAAMNDLFTEPFDRVLLIAPPDPNQLIDTDGIEGSPLDLDNPELSISAHKWARSLTVIASDDDQWLPRGVGIYGPALNLEPLIFPGAGHFSLDQGWGHWSGLAKWVESANPQDLMQR